MIENIPVRIYLMRHAQAVASAAGERDFDRALDDRGYAQAELVATRAADLGYVPECLVSSTAVRCRQTAEAVRKANGETPEIELIDELYNGSAETYATVIAGKSPARSVMLVGHNPSIDQLLESLIGAEKRRTVIPGGYPTGALAVLDFLSDAGEADGGRWALVDFLSS